MKRLACTTTYGKTEIGYELVMMNRKSLEIAVHPDKRVVVKAPSESTREVIEEKIAKKARWIKQQIMYFSQFDLMPPERDYVGGETHFYLGRKYRLKIQASNNNQVVLKDGYFFIDSTSAQPDHIKRLMTSWYRSRAEMQLLEIFNNCWENFRRSDLNKPELKLRKMYKRWGSLSAKGRLTLNVDLIQTPKECIEYVVMHELCHLVHYHHGSEFYKLLDRKIPDWKSLKRQLEVAFMV